VIEDFATENVKYIELRTTPKEVPNKMTKQMYVTMKVSLIFCKICGDCVVSNRENTKENGCSSKVITKYKQI
jgi:hypothetical protein